LQQDTKRGSQSGNQDKNQTPGSLTTRGLFSTIDTSMFLGGSPVTRCCFIDMAASGHLVPRIEDLHSFEPFSHPKSFTVANGGEVTSRGMGIIKINVSGDKGQCIVDVPHVQWAPDIHTHLFSPGQLIKDGFAVNLHRTGCILKDPANQLLADIYEQGNTYPASFLIVWNPSRLWCYC
jgi:Pol polyprotein, beta-barrel domain